MGCGRSADFMFKFAVWESRVRVWVRLGGAVSCVFTFSYFLTLSLSTTSRASADRSGDSGGCVPVLRLFSIASPSAFTSAVSMSAAPDGMGIPSSSIFACSCGMVKVLSKHVRVGCVGVECVVVECVGVGSVGVECVGVECIGVECVGVECVSVECVGEVWCWRC